MPTVHVVSHTHWDREWYHTAGRFRQRLVALVDELLDRPPAGGTSFLLDGQTLVLDDYLAVRPERAAEVAALLRGGALEAGPWFVLADELIPGAEALVRNLLGGRRALSALRADSPPVLYCPDSFGHPAALPTLARGFGLGMVIAWRGYGSRRWPAGDAAWWRASSGDRVLLYHLPRSGYEFGADLPVETAAAAERWPAIHDEVAPRSRLPVALLTNGTDHRARQRRLPEAVAALTAAAAPTRVEASSLRAFAAAALDGAEHTDLPEVRGELRDSYGYTWVLQGTFATRAHQKRHAARLERLLVREVEPWVALADRRSGRSRRGLVRAAWRELLLCHPHDTLCGCSIDAVARAFDARLDEVGAQVGGLRGDAVDDLVAHDPEGARAAHDAWRPHLVVRNPAARPRGGVAIVDLSQFVAHVPVGPGSALSHIAHRRVATPRVDGAAGVQVLARELVHERTESPRDYPDDDRVERLRAAVWVSEMPAYGLRAFPLRPGRNAPAAPPHPVRAERGRLSNGVLSITMADDGAVTLRHEASGRTIAALLTLEDQDDLGDLYTPSLRGAVRLARFTGARVAHRGPLRGAIETRWRAAVRRGGSAVTSSSDPARKLLVRYVDADGHPVADVAHGTGERFLRAQGGRYVDRATGMVTRLDAASGAPLRASALRAGKRASPSEPPATLRERARRAVEALDEGHRRIVSPARYPVGMSPPLAAQKADLLGQASAD